MLWIEKVKAARANDAFDEAMNILATELAQRPSDPQIHYQVAWTHDALGREQDAVPAYERAIELGLSGDDLKGAYLGLVSTYRCLGKYEQSEELFERAIALFPDYRVFQVFRSLTMYNLGRPEKAIEILLRQPIETSSDESIRRYQRALLFYSDKLSETFE